MRATIRALILLLVGSFGIPAQTWGKGHHGGGHGGHGGHGIASPTPTCRDDTCHKGPSKTAAPVPETGAKASR